MEQRAKDAAGAAERSPTPDHLQTFGVMTLRGSAAVMQTECSSLFAYLRLKTIWA